MLGRGGTGHRSSHHRARRLLSPRPAAPMFFRRRGARSAPTAGARLCNDQQCDADCCPASLAACSGPAARTSCRSPPHATDGMRVRTCWAGSVCPRRPCRKSEPVVGQGERARAQGRSSLHQDPSGDLALARGRACMARLSSAVVECGGDGTIQDTVPCSC